MLIEPARVELTSLPEMTTGKKPEGVEVVEQVTRRLAQVIACLRVPRKIGILASLKRQKKRRRQLALGRVYC